MWGGRSGKSSQALSLADNCSYGNKVFVATSQPRDVEMEARVKKHQQDRGPGWRTVECPVELPEIIAVESLTADVLLIDCLTLWVSNLLERKTEESFVLDYVDRLLDALEQKECPVIFVGNEVGAGVVPGNSLARMFRDLNGFVNQRLAARADRVIWMVAGIGVPIKGN